MKMRPIHVLLASTFLVAAAACGSTSGGSSGSGSGKAITLAVNPWVGSAVNANVAKIVLESKLGTKVTIKDIDENASWAGLDDGTIDANLEVWPSGHAADKATYIDEKKTVTDIGLLGPNAKIGWYVPSFVTDADPKLATWEGFKDAAEAKKFATAETGDQGRFLMGDPSYVSYDEQIIANLKLPLKFVTAGSEATLITAIEQADKDHKPLLLQFWKPHWLHAKVKLTEVKLPEFTPACEASAAAKDGKYACDYPVDKLYKVASAKLATKNAKALAFLKKFQLTIEQQNEIGGLTDGDPLKAAAAAKTWVDKNPDLIKAWLA
jgi:glycine betaine/proline transport system substrate-binding protein